MIELLIRGSWRFNPATPRATDALRRNRAKSCDDPPPPTAPRRRATPRRDCRDGCQRSCASAARTQYRAGAPCPPHRLAFVEGIGLLHPVHKPLPRGGNAGSDSHLDDAESGKLGRGRPRIHQRREAGAGGDKNDTDQRPTRSELAPLHSGSPPCQRTAPDAR